MNRKLKILISFVILLVFIGAIIVGAAEITPPIFKTPNPLMDSKVKFSSRGGAPIKYIVLHHTGVDNGQSTINTFTNPANSVSANYVIDENGNIFKMIEDIYATHHSGEGSLPGSGVPDNQMNLYSIGIEITGVSDASLNNIQLQSAKELVAYLQRTQFIPTENIMGHEDWTIRKTTDGGSIAQTVRNNKDITYLHQVASGQIPLESFEQFHSSTQVVSANTIPAHALRADISSLITRVTTKYKLLSFSEARQRQFMFEIGNVESLLGTSSNTYTNAKAKGWAQFYDSENSHFKTVQQFILSQGRADWIKQTFQFDVSSVTRADLSSDKTKIKIDNKEYYKGDIISAVFLREFLIYLEQNLKVSIPKTVDERKYVWERYYKRFDRAGTGTPTQSELDKYVLKNTHDPKKPGKDLTKQWVYSGSTIRNGKEVVYYHHRANPSVLSSSEEGDLALFDPLDPDTEYFASSYQPCIILYLGMDSQLKSDAKAISETGRFCDEYGRLVYMENKDSDGSLFSTITTEYYDKVASSSQSSGSILSTGAVLNIPKNRLTGAAISSITGAAVYESDLPVLDLTYDIPEDPKAVTVTYSENPELNQIITYYPVDGLTSGQTMSVVYPNNHAADQHYTYYSLNDPIAPRELKTVQQGFVETFYTYIKLPSGELLYESVTTEVLGPTNADKITTTVKYEYDDKGQPVKIISPGFTQYFEYYDTGEISSYTEEKENEQPYTVFFTYNPDGTVDIESDSYGYNYKNIYEQTSVPYEKEVCSAQCADPLSEDCYYVGETLCQSSSFEQAAYTYPVLKYMASDNTKISIKNDFLSGAETQSGTTPTAGAILDLPKNMLTGAAISSITGAAVSESSDKTTYCTDSEDCYTPLELYDEEGFLVEDDYFTYDYDDSGNLYQASDKEEDSVLYEYEYDTLGRMSRIISKQDGTETRNIVYDALGNIVKFTERHKQRPDEPASTGIAWLLPPKGYVDTVYVVPSPGSLDSAVDIKDYNSNLVKCEQIKIDCGQICEEKEVCETIVPEECGAREVCGEKIVRNEKKNRIFFQRTSDGWVGLWNLSEAGYYLNYSDVYQGSVSGWFARDVDNNRILFQKNSGVEGIYGTLAIWVTNEDGQWISSINDVYGSINPYSKAIAIEDNKILLQMLNVDQIVSSTPYRIRIFYLNSANKYVSQSEVIPPGGDWTGWRAIDMDKNKILLQSEVSGNIVLWNLDENMQYKSYTSVYEFNGLKGWKAKSLDNDVILLQSDTGLVVLWYLNENNQYDSSLVVYPDPVPGWNALSVQFSNQTTIPDCSTSQCPGLEQCDTIEECIPNPDCPIVEECYYQKVSADDKIFSSDLEPFVSNAEQIRKDMENTCTDYGSFLIKNGIISHDVCDKNKLIDSRCTKDTSGRVGITVFTVTCPNGCLNNKCVDEEYAEKSNICPSGTYQECGTTDVGECSKGTQQCVLGAWHPLCIGEIKPVPEKCDGKDNDCDGTTDEDIDLDGDGYAGSLLCPDSTAKLGDLDDNDASVYPGAEEICDGKDNNYDGQVDKFSVVYTENFNDNIANDFIKREGFAQIIYSDSYQLSSASDANARSDYIGETQLKDYVLTFNAKNTHTISLTGGVPHLGGLFRIKDNNAYSFYLRPDGLYFNKALNGINTRISTSSSIKLISSRYYLFKVELDGSNIKIYIDGVKYVDYNDASNPILTGSFGLFSANAMNYFDNIKIEYNQDLKKSFYKDIDKDGYGLSSSEIKSCSAPPGSLLAVETAGDCNDNDKISYPGAAEICDNRDNDCDTKIDEDSVCISAAQSSEPVGTGGAAPEQEQPAASARTCVDSDEKNIYNKGNITTVGPTGIKKIIYDICSSDQKMVKERSCTIYGYAASDDYSCPNGCVDGACKASCVPAAEVCDNKDNDCDTKIDEDSVCISAAQPSEPVGTGGAVPEQEQPIATEQPVQQPAAEQQQIIKETEAAEEPTAKQTETAEAETSAESETAAPAAIKEPPQPVCTSHKSYQCFGDDIYWFDSCNNKQELKEDCLEDFCLPLMPKRAYCRGNALYNTQFCGDRSCNIDKCAYQLITKEVLVKQCPASCLNAICK